MAIDPYALLMLLYGHVASWPVKWRIGLLMAIMQSLDDVDLELTLAVGQSLLQGCRSVVSDEAYEALVDDNVSRKHSVGL